MAGSERVPSQSPLFSGASSPNGRAKNVARRKIEAREVIYMENILVIGIAGGTGSGKTTLMKNLIAEFQNDVTILSHDNYYKRHDDLTYEERCGLNYDEPAALETDLMAVHHASSNKRRSPWSCLRDKLYRRNQKHSYFSF